MSDSATEPTDDKLVCHVCKKRFKPNKVRPWVTVRPAVTELIQQDYPDWQDGCVVCFDDLSRFRRRYVENLLAEERGELSDLEHQILDSFGSGQFISRNPEEMIEAKTTLGGRTADKVAEFGGSWHFIFFFAAVLLSWMTINVIGLLQKPFDPYPFILLNLVLSSLAAFQAPVIMMSQRRQEEKDRMRAENDYLVNMKAELEIRQLHEKIDHQLARQWQKLAELQQIQIDLIEERLNVRR